MIILRVIIAVLWLLFATGAHAVVAGKGSSPSISRTGGTTGAAGLSSSGGDFGRLSSLPVGGGDVVFQDLLKMPFKPKDFPEDKAQWKGLLTPKNLAKGLRGGVAGYLAGEAVGELIKAACLRGMGGTLVMNPNAAFEECVPGAPQSDGFEYRASNPPNGQWYPTLQGACAAAKAYAMTVYPGATFTELYCIANDQNGYGVKWSLNPSPGFDVSYNMERQIKANCPAGWYITSGGCVQTAPPSSGEYQPVSHEDFDTKLENAIKNPANAGKVLPALREMLDKGGQIDIESPTLTGPASSPTSTSTTTNVSGSTTTTTTITNVTNYTYNNSTMTATQVTTTVNRNAAGTTTSSSTTTGAPGESTANPSQNTPTGEGDGAPSDTPLPPVPDLYVRKYPDGMEGVYNEFKDQLQNSEFMQLVGKLMPSITDGGQCPSWPMSFNFGTGMDYGTRDPAPPCWIWDVAAAILVFSALLLARALIFGG